MVLQRLLQLQKTNPNDLIVPCFGIRQQIYFPLLFRPKNTPSKFFYWFFLKSQTITDLSTKVNKTLESKRRKNEIDALKSYLNKKGFKLYCDYTPMAYYCMDQSILNWFNEEGKKLDFDFLIYYEYDIFTSKTINELYNKYTQHDAAFVNYSKISPTWYWYLNTHGGKKPIRNWLQKNGHPTKLYRGLFSANMVSKKVLSKLAPMQLPQGYCELRFPSIITNLGFKCTNLDFPMVRFRPYLTKTDIKPNWTKGIFHPVLENINEHQN